MDNFSVTAFISASVSDMDASRNQTENIHVNVLALCFGNKMKKKSARSGTTQWKQIPWICLRAAAFLKPDIQKQE
jgi:hypothetical protein